MWTYVAPTQPWIKGFSEMMSMQYRPPGDIYGPQTGGSVTGGGLYSGGGFTSYPTMTASTGGGFSFRKRSDRVDWKKIAAADVDHISRDLDFNTLQENIMNITFCNIESELDVGSMDPHFVKLFKLAQLTIEYLLHSQDYLSGMVAAMEEKLRKAMEEHEETKKALEKHKAEVVEVRKESHKRKKMLVAQQQIMNAGVNSYHKCAYCPKAFVNHTFLQSHLQRRHTEHASQFSTSLTASQPAAPQPAPQPMPQHQMAQSQGQISEEQKQILERELNEIKERLRLTESQLVEERNSRNSVGAKDRAEAARRERQTQQDMEDWKEKQLEEQKHELDKVRDMFMKELKEMNEKYNSATKALDAMQRKGRSNLGAMEDGVEAERQELRKQREEVAELKEQLQEQVADVQSSMSMKFDDQEKRWKEKMKEMNSKHRNELKQLNNTFEKTLDEVHEERQGRSELAEEYEKKLQDMHKVVKQSRDQEKKLRDQERQMEQRAKKVEAPVAAARPPAHKDNVTSFTTEDAVTSLPAARPMSPDDEDEEVSEEEESSEFGDSTLGTTGLQSTMNATGTLSMGTGTLKSMSVRLLDQLKKDPNLLQAMKEELTGVLDDNLEKRGIPPTATGISNPVLHDKLQVLKNERQQMAKKFSNLYDIRQQYIKQVEDTCREYKKRNKKEAEPGPSRSGNTFGASAKHLPPRPVSPTRPASPTRPPTTRSAPPKPAPRALSPTGKLGNTMSTMSSTGTYGTTTGSNSTWGTSTASSNSQWDSDADSDEEPTTARSGQSGRRTPSPKKVGMNMSPGDDEDESDWDDGSELQEITPREPVRTSVNYSPQPRGANVAALRDKIAGQLEGRGKKPAGGIETVQMEDNKAVKKRDDSWDDDDDDDFSVSSLDETASAPPSRNASFNRKQHTPSDLSTGTSVWGSSKDKNRPQPSPRRSAASSAIRGGTLGSVGRLSGISDFDDSDLTMDDL